MDKSLLHTYEDLSSNTITCLKSRLWAMGVAGSVPSVLCVDGRDRRTAEACYPVRNSVSKPSEIEQETQHPALASLKCMREHTRVHRDHTERNKWTE